MPLLCGAGHGDCAGTPLPGVTGEENLLRLHGRGVFVCISPWNFPLAIFVGQVAAALVAGNVVVAKPAPQTPLVARKAVDLFLGAGCPEDVLQFLPGDGALGRGARCPPSDGGRRLHRIGRDRPSDPAGAGGAKTVRSRR